jgi:hypothetical protein
MPTISNHLVSEVTADASGSERQEAQRLTVTRRSGLGQNDRPAAAGVNPQPAGKGLGHDGERGRRREAMQRNLNQVAVFL